MAQIVNFTESGLFTVDGQEMKSHSRLTALSVYNGMDTTNTAQVWEALQFERDPPTEILYKFVKGMRAPAMQMTFRGILIDEIERAKLIDLYEKQERVLNALFVQITEAICGRALNPRSTQQMAELLYQSMRLPPQKKYDKETKQEKLTTDIEALEKLAEFSRDSKFVCDLIITCREMRKKLQVPRSAADADKRMRFSFNVAGPSTGRWSSNKNPCGSGTNGQNITDEMRRMFIPDPGMKLGNVDLSQAESWATGYLSDDEAYIAACAGPDLHTHVARLLWPLYNWTGDSKKDRELAEVAFYRHFSRRDLSKRGGHAKNYMTTAPTMAKKLKIALALAEEFGRNYYSSFPGIPAYHQAVQIRLAQTRSLWSPTGRFRRFFGPRFDAETLRQAVAHLPQSLVGDVLNVALYRIWEKLDPVPVQILLQIHDAILFQYNPAHEAETLAIVKRLMAVPLQVGKRTLTIPCDITCGWNWGKYLSVEAAKEKGLEPNEWGLRKYNGQDTRSPPPPRSLLDQQFS